MSLKSEYPLYLANRAETPNLDLEVVDKFSGKVATRVPLASPALIDEAIGAADKAAGPMEERTHHSGFSAGRRFFRIWQCCIFVSRSDRPTRSRGFQSTEREATGCVRRVASPDGPGGFNPIVVTDVVCRYATKTGL
ncbi:MAG: hypothetical protein JJU29_16405 [Verrucomicrobia bacterium]|nr:hypothetical protein [Verrucomicrobiota bacterium]